MPLIQCENSSLSLTDNCHCGCERDSSASRASPAAPMAVPPVCRLMDFGKFKYQEQKKAHEARLKQKQVQVKEVKHRPGPDENDYQIKLRNLKRFLEEGDKCKVTLRFRGREMAHQEFGLRQLERVKADLEELGQVEQMPKMEGRQMITIIAPKKKH